MKLCKDCIYLEGGIKNTQHTCEAPENTEIDLVTGEVRRRTPEQLRSGWNRTEWACSQLGLWFRPRG